MSLLTTLWFLGPSRYLLNALVLSHFISWHYVYWTVQDIDPQGSRIPPCWCIWRVFHFLIALLFSWCGLACAFCSLTRAPVASEDSGVMISSLLHVHLYCRHSNFCIEGEGGEEQHGHSYHLPEFMAFSPIISDSCPFSALEGLGCQVLCSLQVWLITNYSLALCSQNDRFKTGVVMVIVKPALKTNGAWLCRMMSHTEHRFCYCRPPRAHIVKYGLNPSESVNWGTVSFAGQKGFYSVWFAVCCGRIVMIRIWAVSDHTFHNQGDFQHFFLLFF